MREAKWKWKEKENSIKSKHKRRTAMMGSTSSTNQLGRNTTRLKQAQETKRGLEEQLERQEENKISVRKT